MIRFNRKGTEVSIEIEALVPNWDTRVFVTAWQASSEWAAGLLTELLRNALGDRLKAIRQKAYDRGWADAKAKRGKVEQWMRSLNDV